MDEKLAQLFNEYFNVTKDQLSDILLLENLKDWDSLRHMDLIVSIEQEFDLELTAEEIISIKTYGDIKNILSEKGVE